VAGSRGDHGSVRDVGGELVDLVIAYAKQETIGPLRSLWRFVVFGALGALSMAIGGFLLSLALVRALQSELSGPLGGNLSWVPYLGGIVVALAIVVAAVLAMARKPR
jgi:hypothetical protein